MYIKMMSNENKPDGACDKMHRMFEAEWYTTRRENGELHVGVEGKHGIEWYVADGNVYIMNDAGKTIASIAITDYSSSPEPEAPHNQ